MQSMKDIDITLLQNSARRFQIGFQMAYVLTLTIGAAIFVALLSKPDWIGSALAEAARTSLPTPQIWQSAALAAIAFVVLGTYAAVFKTVTHVCAMLVQGEPGIAASQAKRLSNWLWCLLGVSILAQTLAVLVATFHAGSGERTLSIALGGPQITFAIAALTAACLARAFSLGAALWQDHCDIV